MRRQPARRRCTRGWARPAFPMSGGGSRVRQRGRTSYLVTSMLRASLRDYDRVAGLEHNVLLQFLALRHVLVVELQRSGLTTCLLADDRDVLAVGVLGQATGQRN